MAKDAKTQLRAYEFPKTFSGVIPPNPLDGKGFGQKRERIGGKGMEIIGRRQE
jgi:hypothetical protein